MGNNILHYKGYNGSIDVEFEDECLMGKILDIKDLVTYEAETVSGLKKEFEKSVDGYLSMCKELGRKSQS